MAQPSTAKPNGTVKPKYPWSPGIFRNLPWLGILALLGAVACTAGAVAVVAASDGKRSDSWPTAGAPVKASVLLSILAASASSCVAYALEEGGTIAWWAMMLRGGTVNDAHRYWEYKSSALKSATAGRKTNRVAVACLSALLMFAVGPLFQAASTEVVETRTEPVEFTAALSPDALPWGWSGLYVSHSPYVGWLTPQFTAVLRAFSDRSVISLNTSGACAAVGATCRGVLVAPGWDVNCTASTRPYTLAADGAVAVVGYAMAAFQLPDYGLINVTTAYKPGPDLWGDLVVNTCLLRSAMVRYPVELANGTVRLPPRASAAINDTVSLYTPVVEYQGPGIHPSSLGGIALAAQTLYGSNVTLYGVASLYTFGGSGPMGYTYLDLGDGAGTPGSASMAWRDPAPDMVAAIRELTFRSAVVASNATALQLVSGATHTAAVGVYRSRYGFLAAAVVLTAASLAATAPLFFGWWRLGGRRYRLGLAAADGWWWRWASSGFSLSPVETARAFAAPLLVDYHHHSSSAATTAENDSNEPIDDALERIGDRPLRYGVVVVGAAAAPSAALVEGEDKSGADDGGEGGVDEPALVGVRRLMVAEPSRVTPPESGATY